MFIEQAYRGSHESWRYIIGTIIVFFGWQFLGSIPLLAAFFLKDKPLELPSAGFSALPEIMGKNTFLFLVLISFVAAMVSLLLCVKFLHKLPLKYLTTARPTIDWKRIFFAFALWGIISIGITFFDIFLSPDTYNFQFEPSSFFLLLIISIVFIPIQTSFEEYFTRGYLMQGIGIAAKNRWLPLIISSTLFGVLHIFNPEVEKLGYLILVYYIGTGFFLAILTLMDDGLELPLGFHAANNFFTAILVTTDWTVFQTNALYTDISEPFLGWDVLVPVFIVYPLLLLIFARVYKWNNWSYRLFGEVLSKDEFLAKNEVSNSSEF